MGAILSLKTAPVAWTFMVYNSDDRSTDYWPDDLFGAGVNVSASASHAGRIAGRTSRVTLTGIHSTKDGVNLGEVLLPLELQTGEKDGSYHASLRFAHFLREDPERPGNGWGLFMKLGVSDGNPNPYQAFFTGGIGGEGLFSSRPADPFGIGYFYYNFSDELQSAIDPLAPFDDEQGIEAYYNLLIREWFQLSADLQYVDPGRRANDNAFTGGLRLRLVL
jgi:porin